MKIIEEGKLPGKQVLKGKCSNCKTRFECLVEEAKHRTDCRNESWFEITCPLPGCNHLVFIYV